MKLTDKRFWKFEAMAVLCEVLVFMSVFCFCSNRHDLTDNYSIFTYGDGLYGEIEKDYPIFVSKLGYKDEPSFIANVRNVWWNDSAIIIERNNNSWWIVTAVGSQLSYGDKYIGPLSEQRKDSIILAEKISIEQMKHRNYE